MSQDFRHLYNKKVQSYFFFGLLIGMVFLALYLFYQFLAPLIVAGILSILFRPLYSRMRRSTKMPAWLISLILVVLITVIILVPIFLLGTQVYNELRAIDLGAIATGSLVERINGAVNGFASRVAPGYSFDVVEVIGNATNALRQNLGGIFASLAQFGLKLFVFFISLFYLLKDGSAFKHALVKLSPLSDDNDEAIFHRLTQTVNSVVKGTLLIGILQGLVSFIGMTIFGAPSPALLATLVMLAAILPGIGMIAVLAPVVIYMFVSGDTGLAIGLGIWSLASMNAIDHLLGPIFIGKGAKIHPLLILLSVLGGLFIFGPIGFLIGPLIVSFLFALLDIYASDFDEPEKEDA